VAPRAGLDDMEKRNFLTPPGLQLRPLGRPARSQSLNRLSYPEDHKVASTINLEFVQCIFRYILANSEQRTPVRFKLNFNSTVIDWFLFPPGSV
jgi:hypothetical protein